MKNKIYGLLIAVGILIFYMANFLLSKSRRNNWLFFMHNFGFINYYC